MLSPWANAEACDDTIRETGDTADTLNTNFRSTAPGAADISHTSGQNLWPSQQYGWSLG
jgi:hypothetical protein